MSSRMALLVLIGVSACYRPDWEPGIVCSAEGECPSPFMCVDGRCQPEGGAAADGAPDGSIPPPDAVPVDAPSNGEPDASCGELLPFTPSIFDACVLDGIQPALSLLAPLQPDLSGAYQIDTDTAILTGPDVGPIQLPSTVIDQVGAPDLLIVATRSLVIGRDAGLGITGDRALALVALGDLTVQGQISAGAVGTLNGPGGNVPESCATGRGAEGVVQIVDATMGGSGGGGGGFGDVGGPGAPVEESGGAPSDGGFAGGVPGLVPLRGGCAGGKGGLPQGGAGGGGGGALQLVAGGELLIESGGFVTARGGRGLGIHAVDGNSSGGGGGGSGGGLLLEASTIVINGAVTANGGGGGEGARTGDNTVDGQDGRDSQNVRATGGIGLGSGGNGGDGGAAIGVAGLPGQEGDTFGGLPAGGGGGGGSAGRIHLRSVAADPVFGPASVISPSAQ
jgi:hypothetical protein